MFCSCSLTLRFVLILSSLVCEAQDLVFFENNRKRVNAVDVVFRCFIICWNLHSEWKLIEFGTENQDGFIVNEYDVVEDKVLSDNLVSQPANLLS